MRNEIKEDLLLSASNFAKNRKQDLRIRLKVLAGKETKS